MARQNWLEPVEAVPRPKLRQDSLIHTQKMTNLRIVNQFPVCTISANQIEYATSSSKMNYSTNVFAANIAISYKFSAQFDEFCGDVVECSGNVD